MTNKDDAIQRLAEAMLKELERQGHYVEYSIGVHCARIAIEQGVVPAIAEYQQALFRALPMEDDVLSIGFAKCDIPWDAVCPERKP